MMDNRRSLYLSLISGLIEQRVGLAQGALSATQLEQVVDTLAVGDYAELAHRLTNSADTDGLWQQLLDELVIGETYFFRSRAHFDLLRNVIIPHLIHSRSRSDQRMNVWSVGCASGEEAYSLAITFYEALAQHDGWSVRLTGTDINGRALRVAERGLFRTWSFRQGEQAWRDKYFIPSEGGFQLRPAIRQMVQFQQMNLLSDAPLAQWDVIFCRNVLLYFAERPARAAETRLYESLAPGGWLVMGQAEAIRHERERWTTHQFPGAMLYQKPSGRSQSTVYQNPRRPAVTRSLSPLPPVNSYRTAVEAVRSKHYEEAGRLLADLVQAQPDDPAAHTLLASLFANRGAIPESLAQIEQALKANASYADAHYLKGVLLLESGDEAAARACLRSALYCRRGHPLAAMILGNLFTNSGERMRARRVWQEALEELDTLSADVPCSDVSDMTTASVRAFLKDQMDY